MHVLVYCCVRVSLAYQSASAVLIGQKIFPLMCLGMMGKGGGSFHLASKLLREHLSINISRQGEGSGAGR